MNAPNLANEAKPKSRSGGSREAIVQAAERLFLQRGFGAVTMDDLAEAAGVARRTLYNQFARKEDIFREMLLRVSAQLEHVYPQGIETQGEVGEVLRIVARLVLKLHKNPEYLGFLRMVVADSRHFPWIAADLAAVMKPPADRLIRYLTHLNAVGVLDCPNPTLAAHQLMGMINQFALWPWMLGSGSIRVSDKDIIEGAIRMFLGYYRRTEPTKRVRSGTP